MYGFPDQSTQHMSSRLSRHLFGAFVFTMSVGVAISFYMRFRDLNKAITAPGYGSIDHPNYLNGDVLARRAAQSHRRIRLRKESRGEFDGHMRFAENLVFGSKPKSTSESSTDKR